MLACDTNILLASHSDAGSRHRGQNFRDGGEPVTGDYPGTYPISFAGFVKRVVVDVNGEVSIHHEREVHALLMRE